VADIDWNSARIQSELRSRLKHIMEYLEDDLMRCVSDTAAGTRCKRQREDIMDVIQCWQHRP
jgi:metal-dependent amidase/aminoacylase/carboxypeptidase family protein